MCSWDKSRAQQLGERSDSNAPGTKMALFSMARNTSHGGRRVHLQGDALAQEGVQGPGGLTMSSVQRSGLGYVNGRQTRRGGHRDWTRLHWKPKRGVQQGPQRSWGRARRKTESGKQAPRLGELGLGQGAAAHTGVPDPARIFVPSWDWWPQTRPSAACSATQVAFGLSPAQVEQIWANLIACVRWAKGRQIPSRGASRSGSRDGRLLRHPFSCPVGSRAPAW